MPHKDIPNMLGKVLSGTKYGVKQVGTGEGEGGRSGQYPTAYSVPLPVHPGCTAAPLIPSQTLPHPLPLPLIPSPLPHPLPLPLIPSPPPPPSSDAGQVWSGCQDGAHLVQDDDGHAL